MAVGNRKRTHVLRRKRLRLARIERRAGAPNPGDATRFHASSWMACSRRDRAMRRPKPAIPPDRAPIHQQPHRSTRVDGAYLHSDERQKTVAAPGLWMF